MKAHLWNLDKIFEDSCIDLNTIIVISDTRIKNNITTLTSHVCSGQNILTKTIYHAVNVTSTEAELFTIRDRSIIQLLIKTKQFNYIPNFSCKSLTRKRNVTSLFEIGKWHFKHHKRNNFLNLLKNKYLPIKLTYTKSRTWLKLCRYSNLLCTKATRAITNYTSIGKYYFRFFSKELFEYLWDLYLIESIYHILHECRKYNNYWNSNSKSLEYFIAFLEFNPDVFSFYKDITW